MTGELGQLALCFALALSLVMAVSGLMGTRPQDLTARKIASGAAMGLFVFVALAFGALTYAFVTSDFSIIDVANNSHTLKPLIYKISGVWANHEGSMLLWVLVLSIYAALVAGLQRGGERLTSGALGVQGLLAAAFILFIIFTSNPFLRLDPAPFEGAGLNPLLQDPGLAMHPPMLYAGYVGLSASFSYAAAALLVGEAGWTRAARPFMLIAWIALTCGIALGSWWAYYELGWGGFWFWDPVENASFMPWLIGTALIHSLAVTDKRGLFKSWTLLLAVTAFSLSLIGTFLVRSGVLVSVHSFAADPSRGIFILILLVVMIGGALALYAWRAPLMKSAAGFDFISRGSFLLFNNILLTIAAAVVFGGTLAPMIADTLGLGTLSVGPPYFNPSFLVPILPMLALVALGMHARWRRGGLGEARRPLLAALGVALILGLALSLGVYAHPLTLTPIGATVGLWIILSSLIDPIERLRRRQRLPASVAGMCIAHIGLGVFVLGITFVQSNTIERDIALKPGQSALLGTYQFRYEGGQDIEGPNYEGFRGKVSITRNGVPVSVLYPEKRRYLVQGTVQTTAAIAAGLNRDLLAALGEDVGAGAWSLRLQYRPLIRFVWIGALIMAIGGVTAVIGRRQRGLAPQGARLPLGAAAGELHGEGGAR